MREFCVSSLALMVGIALHAPLVGGQEQSGASAGGAMLSEVASRDLDLRATTLVAAPIEDATGRQIGTVKDMLVHIPSGRMPWFVVSLGSLLGPDLWLIPSTSIRPFADRPGVQLVMSRDELSRQRRFSPSEWPDLDNTGFWSGGTAVDEERRRIQAKQTYLATDIIGETVENSKGEHLGTIREIIIDPAVAQAHALVLEFDPGLLQGEVQVAVPVARFVPPPETPHSLQTIDSLIIEIDRDEINRLPVVRASGRFMRRVVR